MKKLFIDLEVCYKCRECTAECDYYNRDENDGVACVLERATKMLVCRKCETAPCVEGCIFDALEKQEDGTLKRYNMKCTGCQTCSIACPFGAAYPQIVPYLTSQCDYCLESCGEEGEPLCVRTCPLGALKYIEVEESEEGDVYIIGKRLAVHSLPWRKD